MSSPRAISAKFRINGSTASGDIAVKDTISWPAGLEFHADLSTAELSLSN